MKRTLCTLALSAALLGLAAAPALSAEQTIIRNGDQKTIKGPAKIFTGDVRIETLYPANNSMRSSGGKVTFAPGARSHWHTHPVGQVLIVTEGVGRVGVWNGPVIEIRPGDVVMCPEGVKHWHGASPNTAMTHISVCEEKEPGKVVEWMEEVTDEQYNKK